MSTEKKMLNPNLAWLFALAAAAVAIGVTLALFNPLKLGNLKIIFGATAIASAVLAGASTLLTSAKTLGVVGRFALAAVVTAGFYIWFAHHLMGQAVSAAADAGVSVTGDTGPLATFAGTVGGVVAFILVLMGSVVGGVIGSRLRAGKGYGMIPARG